MNLAKLRRARRPPSAPPSAPSSAPSSAPPSPRVELPSSVAPSAADEAAARDEETKQGILVTLLRSVPSAGAHSSVRPVSGPPSSSALFLPAYSSSSSSSPCSAGPVPTSHVFNKDFLRALAPSELLKKSAKDYLEGLLSPRAAVAILDAISTAKGDANLATVSTVRDLGGTAMLSATDKAAIKTALQHSLVLQSKFHSAIHFAQELLLSELDAESDGADSKCPEEQGGPSVSSSSSSSSSSSLNSSSSSSSSSVSSNTSKKSKSKISSSGSRPPDIDTTTAAAAASGSMPSSPMDKYDLIKSQKRAPQKRKLDSDNSSGQKFQKRLRGTPAKGRIYAGIPDAFNLFPGQPLPDIGTFVDLKFSGYGWYAATITKVTEKPGKHLATKFRINAADETGGKSVSWKSFQTGNTVAPFGRHTRVSSFAAQMSGQPDTMRAKLLAVVRSLMSQRWDRNVERGSQLDDMFYVFFHPVLEMDPSIDAQEYSRVVSSPISFAELRSRINEGEFDDDAYAFFSALEQISTNAEAWVAHKHGPLPDVNPNVRKQILTPARALRRLAKYLWKTHFAKGHTSAGVSKDEIRLWSC